MAAAHAPAIEGDEAGAIVKTSANNEETVSRGRGCSRRRVRGLWIRAIVLAAPSPSDKRKDRPHCDAAFYHHVPIFWN